MNLYSDQIRGIFDMCSRAATFQLLLLGAQHCEGTMISLGRKPSTHNLVVKYSQRLANGGIKPK